LDAAQQAIVTHGIDAPDYTFSIVYVADIFVQQNSAQSISNCGTIQNPALRNSRDSPALGHIARHVDAFVHQVRAAIARVEGKFTKHVG